MLKHSIKALSIAAPLVLLGMHTAQAAPALMSAEWAKSACEAWNQESGLTKGLEESGWTSNDAGRGFKLIQIYRSDCKKAPRVELRISRQDKAARCTYGGTPQAGALQSGTDYVMWADTEKWTEMGRGDYGPMKAMMLGRLNFEGPKMEAMGNMGPFESFLLLVGKVASDKACPGD